MITMKLSSNMESVKPANLNNNLTLLQSKDIFSNPRIALVDMQKALLESEAATKYSKISQKSFQPKIDKLTKERERITVEETNLKKVSEVLSAETYKEKSAKLEQEKDSFFQSYQELRQEKELADKKELERIEPLLHRSLQTLAEKNNLDYIFEKSALLYAKPTLDLTEQATKTLNSLTEQLEKTKKESNDKNKNKNETLLNKK